MPKGKMLRTKIREELIASQAVANAVEQAKQDIHVRQEKKKPLVVSLREHIGKMIDRVDPLEMGAVIATTLLIHETYDWASISLSALQMRGGMNIFGIMRKSGDTALSRAGEFLESVPDPIIWLISFVSAFYIVRHGAEIAKAVSNVISMLKLIA